MHFKRSNPKSMYKIIITLLYSCIFLFKLNAQPGSNVIEFRTYQEKELAFRDAFIDVGDVMLKRHKKMYRIAKRTFNRQRGFFKKRLHFFELGIDTTNKYVVLVACTKKYISKNIDFPYTNFPFTDSYMDRRTWCRISYVDKGERIEYAYTSISFMKISDMKKRKPAIKTIIYQNKNGLNIRRKHFMQNVYLSDDNKSQIIYFELDPFTEKSIILDSISREYILPPVKF
jgi:hypothetical protein